MLADRPPRTARLSDGGETREEEERGDRRLPRVLAFAGAMAIVLVYALRGGGSYDAVVFQEHGLAVWCLLALGFASGLLPRARPSRAALVFLGALGAYAAWTALSLIWSESSELTSGALARTVGFLGIATLAVCALDGDTWRSAAAGAGFAGLVVCVVAVGSHLAPSVFGADHLDHVLHIDRLSRPFGYWNAVAAWGPMCAAFGLAFGAHDTVRVRRMAALGLVPVAALTTYLTYSRAGVAGMALALLTVIVFSRNRLTVLIHIVAAAAASAVVILVVRREPQIAHVTGTGGAGAVALALVAACAACGLVALGTGAANVDGWRLPRRLSRGLAIAGGVAALALVAAFGIHAANRAWHSFTQIQANGSTTNPTARLTSLSGTRYPLWRSAFHAFDAHPLDGIGAGAWEFWWNRHATDTEFVRNTHNIWLENLAELGLPGLLLIVAVAVSALWLAVTARRRARGAVSAGAAAALLAVFIVYLLHASVDWMWQSTATTVLALGGVAILAGGLAGGRLALGLPSRALLAVLAAVAAVIQLPGLLSTAAVTRSQRAERTGNATVALAWAQQAIEAEPWSATAYEQRALVYESGGRFALAAADLRRAIDREPTNYTHWLILSRVETELGNIPRAVADFHRAYALRPTASVFATVAARH